jgi:hypothetical protein
MAELWVREKIASPISDGWSKELLAALRVGWSAMLRAQRPPVRRAVPEVRASPHPDPVRTEIVELVLLGAGPTLARIERVSLPLQPGA